MADPAPDLGRLRIERDGPGRSARGARGRSGLMALVVLLLAVVAWLAWPRLAALRDSRPIVTLGRVVRTGGAQAVSGVAANGYVVARRQAALSTDIQGRLVELRVEEGSRVASGDLIARLDTRELEAALQRSRAELATSRATLELAELDLKRKEPLLTNGDVSQADVDAARARRDEVESTVASLQAAMQETEVRIQKSSVFAPFDGVVTAKNAEVGEVVSSISSGGNSRGSVATLVDFDTLEVQVELSQTSLKAARTGAPVLIYLDAYPERAYKGAVRQIWPTADRQKSTVELRAEFVERDERILPEMGVRVVFTAEDAAVPTDVEIRVPERAVLRGDGAGGDGPGVVGAGSAAAGSAVGTSGVSGSVADAAVFVVTAGKAQRVSVKLDGAAHDGTVRVTSGLKGGESVVLDPPPALQSGDDVRTSEPGP